MKLKPIFSVPKIGQQTGIIEQQLKAKKQAIGAKRRQNLASANKRGKTPSRCQARENMRLLRARVFRVTLVGTAWF